MFILNAALLLTFFENFKAIFTAHSYWHDTVVHLFVMLCIVAKQYSKSA